MANDNFSKCQYLVLIKFLFFQLKILCLNQLKISNQNYKIDHIPYHAIFLKNTTF